MFPSLLFTVYLWPGFNVFYGRMRNLVAADFHVMQRRLSYLFQSQRVIFAVLCNDFCCAHRSLNMSV